MRIAVREEGDTIHAYVAHTDTMQDAISVVQMKAIVSQYDEVQEAFNALVKTIGVGIAEEIVGQKVCGIITEDAPEHERPGHA